MVQAAFPDIPGHIARLSELLDLGIPVPGVQQVFGGLHHRMWRLDTSSGRFAVKQLGADIELGQPAVRSHFNVTESVAEAFARRGIPAIHARSAEGSYLQCLDDMGYLVYPWTDAVAVAGKHPSERHALAMAGVLAALHRVKLSVDGVEDFSVNPQSGDKVKLLVAIAETHNARDHAALKDHLPKLLEILAQQQAAIPILSGNTLVSHGDLDRKNVLWSDRGKPLLIDWESARRLNPAHELLLVALDWSGITTTFEFPLFEKFVETYLDAGGLVDQRQLEAACHAVLGDWLDWLMFNVGRSFDVEDDDQRSLGSEQVDLALSTILRLQRHLPQLLARTTHRLSAA